MISMYIKPNGACWIRSHPHQQASLPVTMLPAIWTSRSISGKLIHCDLTYGNMASWSYWTCFAQEKWGAEPFLSLENECYQGDNSNESYGDIQTAGIITDNSNLWVLGNYSRFIRPGYKRIDHITNKKEDLDQLLGSAYLSPDGKRIVLVYVNMMATQSSVHINIEGQNAAKDINVYRTSAKENLKHIKSNFSLDKLIAIHPRALLPS